MTTERSWPQPEREPHPQLQSCSFRLDRFLFQPVTNAGETGPEDTCVALPSIGLLSKHPMSSFGGDPGTKIAIRPHASALHPRASFASWGRNHTAFCSSPSTSPKQVRSPLHFRFWLRVEKRQDTVDTRLATLNILIFICDRICTHFTGNESKSAQKVCITCKF